jgi:hypothetical protein
LNRNVVPYGTFTMSVFNKGQQSFVRFLCSFERKYVVPIITHDSSLDEALLFRYSYSLKIQFKGLDLILGQNCFFIKDK